MNYDTNIFYFIIFIGALKTEKIPPFFLSFHKRWRASHEQNSAASVHNGRMSRIRATSHRVGRQRNFSVPSKQPHVNIKNLSVPSKQPQLN